MSAVIQAIEKLKQERQAVILAHNYQQDAVQDIADFVGDSLALSRYAASTTARVVVLAGVRFMAESASILAPDKIILLPDSQAGCPLAASIDVAALRQAKARYPDAAVVCYVNTPADVKAESDICCTSSNAVAVVRSLPQQRILFVPDRNLASFVARFTSQEIIPWEGGCITHYRVTLDELEQARAAHPEAEVLVHPECRPEVTAAADFVGSTTAIIKYARESRAGEFLIGTEMGILHRLLLDNPEKKFYLLSPGLVCPNMKLTSLEKIARCLREMQPEVKVPETIRQRAYGALERMLAI
ncbi:quinolinate synthase NadA [Moorella naiadis]|uniref:quinolinate synthase NadA n=1 Tax=Moorella naiadis (nom. illeg.) TaxID=3093670 RepID=UPI003D9C9381